jgi:hypothetical protein
VQFIELCRLGPNTDWRSHSVGSGSQPIRWRRDPSEDGFICLSGYCRTKHCCDKGWA